MTRAPGTDLQAICLGLLERGHTTFPVGPNERGEPKKPLIRGFHDLRPTRSDVRRWPWSRALGLGWSLPVDLIALDVDVKHGLHGMEHLAELTSLLGPLPPTSSQTSPTGGLHLVFRVGSRLVRDIHKPRLPDGSPAHIDVAKRGALFLRLYDLDLPLRHVADLPAAWCEYLARALPQPGKAGDAFWRSDEPTDRVLSSLSNAPAGERNNTLYDAVRWISTNRDWTAEVEAGVMAAALQSGLHLDGILGTIHSARRPYVEREQLSEDWLHTVRQDPQFNTRARPGLNRMAGVLADLHVRHGSRFGLSVREGAERTGMSRTTVHQRLADLHGASYLREYGSDVRGRPKSYSLTRPRSNSDSHAVGGPVHMDQVPTDVPTDIRPPTTARLSELAHSRAVLTLATRDAFIREGRRAVLSPTAVEVLTSVQEGAVTTREIADKCGVSQTTVRKHLRALAEPPHGLLDYSPRGRPVAVINNGRLSAQLDCVEQASGAVGAQARKKMRFSRERAAYLAHLGSEGNVSGEKNDANLAPNRNSNRSISLLLNRRT